ncbi:hypothetical protein F3Y22_tig00110607pilonHSYRG00009 [Hibiscus syriacus]|uniref:DUF4283 domain-containing protein n=1 Tax=Hibiscus syriacus TaxID=106335 RepID=A0A6A3A162_HIBSY|nr:hypothetical protein F3Y22_tig00110607pilonHSYRG00009 [Hibiscus syriacus]
MIRVGLLEVEGGEKGKSRGCYTYATADVRTGKWLWVWFVKVKLSINGGSMWYCDLGMYCPVQRAGEFGWDQDRSGSLKSCQAEHVCSICGHCTDRSIDWKICDDISPPRVIAEDDLVEMDKWIVGKIICYKRVDIEVVLWVFCSIWGHARLTNSSILKDNMFLFKFKSLSDKQAILKRTPWSFEGTILAIAHFDPTLSLEESDFRPLAMWVRIYELPLGLIRIETAEKIGNRIGKTIATDTRSGEGRMGDYLRVRVEIDCTKGKLTELPTP